MNADSKETNNSNLQSAQSYDQVILKLYPIEGLETRLEPHIYSQIQKSFKSYRELSLKDPNAILKVLSLSLLEFIFLACETPEDFETNLSQFASITYMEKCQNHAVIKYTEFELKAIRQELVKELYKYKHLQQEFNIDPTFIYNVVGKHEKFTRFLVLLARGMMLEFLMNPSKDKDTFLEYIKVSSQILNIVVCNYQEDFNINSQVFLDPFCVLFGRSIRLLYASGSYDQLFPKFLKTNSSFLETIVMDKYSIYWISTHEPKEKLEKVNKMNGYSYEEFKMNRTPTPSEHKDPSKNSPFSSAKKPREISSIPRPLGDSEGDTFYNAEESCKKCSSMLLRCKQIKALYCNSCDVFLCNDCQNYFNQRVTCKCRRCLCCFREYCVPPLIIGLKCQTVCHICYEENDPSTYNIIRYDCGHGICRFCMLKNAVVDKFNPRYCAICKK